MSGARILKPGPLCTIQDLGRTSGRRQGVSPGGAMDRRAFLWANHLLGNAPGVPALEVTMGGLTLEFEEAATLAITGAECRPVAGTALAGEWRTIQISTGERLTLGYPKKGLRTYLAFPGGLNAKTFYGSASTVIREGLPGRLGSALVAGDVLGWSTENQVPARIVPPAFSALPGPVLTLPFLRGFEWDGFSGEDRRQLLASEWRVGSDSDRVATRLHGPPLESGPRVLDSTPIVDGTIQVLPSGQPLVFMRDRPTMGGYPKMGSVLPEALDLLAQAPAQTRIRFSLGDASQAREFGMRVAEFFGMG